MSDSTRQQQVLNAMGIDQWVPKEHLEVVAESEVVTPKPKNPEPAQKVNHNVKSVQAEPGDEPRVEPGNILGRKKETDADEKTVEETPLIYTAPDADKIKTLDWEPLQQLISECGGCDLHEGRTQTVFGAGDQSANWLIIGEAPGQQEDIQGEPFVGRAGQLLDNMLLAVGQPRDKVYIANVVKCRPPGNRDPKDEETSACQSYLKRQVELIKPKLILVVGRIAAQSLLATTTPVGKLRGQVYQFPQTEIPMVITYHPAYLLRRPSEKAKSWQDLKLAMATYNEV